MGCTYLLLSSLAWSILIASSHQCELSGAPLHPGSCDFSHDECGYILGGYWERGSGQYKTPFSFTAQQRYLTEPPKTANTSGGSYIHFNPIGYVSGYTSSENVVTSPPISAGSYCLSFWYSKATNESGLAVSVKPDTGASIVVWNKTAGVSAHVWTRAYIQIQSGRYFKIQLHNSGVGNDHLIGIDDINIGHIQIPTTLVPRHVNWACTFTHGDPCNMTVTNPWRVNQGPLLLHGHPIIPGGQDDDTFMVFDSYILSTPHGQYIVMTPWFLAGSYNLTFWHYLVSGASILGVHTVSTYNDTTLVELKGRHPEWLKECLLIDEPVDFQIHFVSSRGSSTGAFVGIDNIFLQGDVGSSMISVLTTKSVQLETAKTDSLQPSTMETTLENIESSFTVSTDYFPHGRTKPVTVELTSTETYPPSMRTDVDISPATPTTDLYSKLRLEDTISHICTTSQWNITINMTLMNQLYPYAGPENIFFGESACKGQMEDDVLEFNYGLKECLTSEKITNTTLLYENDLMYVEFDPFNQFLIRQHKWTFTVECDITRNDATSSHVHHDVEHHHATANSSYSVSLKFYRDPNFRDEISGNPLHVNVGDKVYVKVYTSSENWDVKLRLHSCFTRPSSDAPESMNYFLIQDGCEMDHSTHIISQSSHETTFVFQDFEYASNHEGLDLSCSATFCEGTDYSAQCQQRCYPAGPPIIG